MVICAMIGCSNRFGRDKIRFHLPAVVQGQGKQMHSITKAQRRAWLKAIYRDDLTADKLVNAFISEEHFARRTRFRIISYILCRQTRISDVHI